MATLIIGPSDLTKSGRNLKNKSKLDIADMSGAIDVIIYREGKEDIVVKAPNKK